MQIFGGRITMEEEKQTKVIKRKNLPSRPPLLLTAVLYLFLDKFNAPDLIWGILGTLMAIIWVAVIYSMVKEDDVDIFEWRAKNSA
jgi:hypothetical protein